jgi:hypothetical protein
LVLAPIALDATPSLPTDGQSELQVLKDRSREWERRSAELEAEILALKKANAHKETESSTVQQQFRNQLVGECNAKIESYRSALTRYYETELAAVDNRLKKLAEGRAEWIRFFESEQAIAEAQIQDIRDRQKALKN